MAANISEPTKPNWLTVEPSPERREHGGAGDGADADHPEQQAEPVRPQAEPLVHDQRQQCPEGRRREPEQAQPQEQPPRPRRVPGEPEPAPDRLHQGLAGRGPPVVAWRRRQRSRCAHNAKTTALTTKVAGAPNKERPRPPATGPMARARLNVAPSTRAAERHGAPVDQAGDLGLPGDGEGDQAAADRRPPSAAATTGCRDAQTPATQRSSSPVRTAPSRKPSSGPGTSARPRRRWGGRAGRTERSSQPARRRPRSRSGRPRSGSTAPRPRASRPRPRWPAGDDQHAEAGEAQREQRRERPPGVVAWRPGPRPRVRPGGELQERGPWSWSTLVQHSSVSTGRRSRRR